jgi:hypothetical protein
MEQETSSANTASWLIEKFVIYLLPVAFVLYVDYTKCFPYSIARWLWKGTRHQHSPHVQDGFLYGVGLAISVSIYYSLKFILKKFRKK